MLLDVIVAGGVSVILCLAIFFDLRKLRLPDGLSLALLVLAPLHLAGLETWGALGWQLGFALCVFVALFAAFAFRLLGGGDVKLLTALAIFVPINQIAAISLTFSGALVAGILFVLVARHLQGGKPSNWAFLTSNKLPMGLSIGLAGLAVVVSNAAHGLGLT